MLVFWAVSRTQNTDPGDWSLELAAVPAVSPGCRSWLDSVRAWTSTEEISSATTSKLRAWARMNVWAFRKRSGCSDSSSFSRTEAGSSLQI